MLDHVGGTDDRDRRKGASAGYLEGNICHLITGDQLKFWNVIDEFEERLDVGGAFKCLYPDWVMWLLVAQVQNVNQKKGRL